jgi:hypothetical protein
MYDDLLGKRKPEKPKPKTFSPPQKKIKVAKWDIATYEKEAYCYQCGSTSITVVTDKLTKGKLVKKIQCNTCFSEWAEIWDENGQLESIGFKF